jgi:hypothetical protein
MRGGLHSSHSRATNGSRDCGHAPELPQATGCGGNREFAFPVLLGAARLLDTGPLLFFLVGVVLGAKGMLSPPALTL